MVFPGRPGTVARAAGTDNELETVLSQMDASAVQLKTAQASFELRTIPAVPNEINVRKGHIYFRRKDASPDAMIQVRSPVLLQIHFVDGKLSTYEEGIDEVKRVNLAGHDPELQALLCLAFGAGGHVLAKSYQVALSGWETVEGIKAARLELTPLSPVIQHMFSRVTLWVDAQRDVPLQAQGYGSSGGSLLLEFRDIKINSKLDDYVFHFHALSSSGYIRPD